MQGPLRLCLKNHRPDAGLKCVTPMDALIDVRIAALRWFISTHPDSETQTAPNLLFPTPFQRCRLMLMLKIVDYLSENKGDPSPVRKIAQLIVYRNTKFASAAEWKTSSQRRRTQRLIEEAKSLVAGGYRALLKAQFR